VVEFCQDRGCVSVSKKPLISAEALSRRIQELGLELSQHYGTEPFTVVTLMNGGFMFIADLCRKLPLQAKLAFVRTSSYGNSTQSSGQVRFEEIPKDYVHGQKVLLVDDILDTGRTLTAVHDHLQSLGAQEVRTCVLLDKPSRRQVSIQATWHGFTVEDLFIVGYGLDYAGMYRQLPDIRVLELEAP